MFIGVDTHKDTLASCIVDAAGRQVDQRVFDNAPAGHAELLDWAHAQSRPVVRVGVEGSANFGAGLAQFLHGQGVDVREVPASSPARTKAAAASWQERPHRRASDRPHRCP